MKTWLKPVSLKDGQAVWEMLQEIGPGENGFQNRGYGVPFSDFYPFLKSRIEMANGIGLDTGFVEASTYWLFDDNRPVGIGKLRHRLTESLLQHGGHIGFCVRPSERGKGYGNVVLEMTVQRARTKGIDLVLLTCYKANTASRRVIENNDGYLEKIEGDQCFYWIEI